MDQGAGYVVYIIYILYRIQANLYRQCADRNDRNWSRGFASSVFMAKFADQLEHVFKM